MSSDDQDRRPIEEHDAMQGAPEAVTAGASRESQLEQALEQVRHVLAGLRYGVVSIVVQDGVVVQIERTEKHRLRR